MVYGPSPPLYKARTSYELSRGPALARAQVIMIRRKEEQRKEAIEKIQKEGQTPTSSGSDVIWAISGRSVRFSVV